MKKQCFSIITFFIKKALLINIILYIYILPAYSQAVYVDEVNGDDNNDGSEESPFYSIHKAIEIIQSGDNDIYVMKINPGIYVLENYIPVSTEKDMTGKRIVIEAGILPGDPSWTPEKMPVIVNKSKKGLIQGFDDWIVSFFIDESRVTIRGIKFSGYLYPNSYYFPIARINKQKTDLLVKQCMFVADEHASHIQVAVIAHGNEIKVDHCVFYKVANGVVYWENADGSSIKTGNALTNTIIIGGFSAIWTSLPDDNFVFENNIVTDCNFFWIKNYFNETIYSIDNCVIVNNQHYQGVWYEEGVIPEAFEINETNIIKEGEISLRLITDVDSPLPEDYLHILSKSIGYDLEAGLFEPASKTDQGAVLYPAEYKLYQNYPNPFNQSTIINYQLSKPCFIKIDIFNIQGQKLAQLYKGNQITGSYNIEWDGKNELGNTISSGIYLYQIETNNQIFQKKMLLIC
jgi:hypothetical protein